MQSMLDRTINIYIFYIIVIFTFDGGFGGHRTGGRVGASVSEATNAMTCNIFEEAIFWTLYATDLIVLFTSLVC